MPKLLLFIFSEYLEMEHWPEMDKPKHETF